MIIAFIFINNLMYQTSKFTILCNKRGNTMFWISTENMYYQILEGTLLCQDKYGYPHKPPHDNHDDK